MQGQQRITRKPAHLENFGLSHKGFGIALAHITY